MRKFLLIALMLFVPCFAAEINAVSQPVTMPQNIMFADCTKILTVNKEKLFYLTLASLSANRFLIDEVQTSNG